MKINMHIIYDELGELIAETRCRDSCDLNLSGVRLYSAQTDDLKISSRLYIVRDEDLDSFLSNHRYSSFVYYGDRRLDGLGIDKSMDVVRIPSKFDLLFVYDKLHSVFECMDAWYEEILSGIIKGKSLQSILDMGSRRIANPIALHDAFSMCLGSSGAFPDGYHDVIWDDIRKTNLGFSSEVSVALERDEALPRKHVSILRNIDRTKLPFEAVTVDIVLGSKVIGYLAATSVWGPFSRGQISLMAAFAECLGAANTFAARLQSGQANIDQITESLIAGESVDPYLFERTAAHYGLGSRDHQFVVMVTDMEMAEINDKPLGDQWKMHHSYLKLLQRDRPYDEAAVLYGSYLVVIVPTSQLLFKSILVELGRIQTLFAPLTFAVGISEPFDDYLAVKPFFDQAVAALAIGRRAAPEENVYYFKDYALEFLFDEAPYLTMDAFCCWAAKTLWKHDEKMGTDYLRLVECLVQSNGNLSKAAERLFMHRNTLMYKIKKIEEYLGVDSIESLDWSYFQLSCRIIRWEKQKYASLE